ncbi:MAG: ribbon-helix-helix protein, CopG family [Myxococcaceae bacterium]
MKAVQITLDEALLEALDRDDEVQKEGRSAVLRKAAVAYLERKRKQGVARAYRSGYGKKPTDELEGWEREGVWPDE